MENKIEQAIDNAVANLNVDNLGVTEEQKNMIKARIETMYLNKENVKNNEESVKKIK